MPRCGLLSSCAMQYFSTAPCLPVCGNLIPHTMKRNGTCQPNKALQNHPHASFVGYHCSFLGVCWAPHFGTELCKTTNNKGDERPLDKIRAHLLPNSRLATHSDVKYGSSKLSLHWQPQPYMLNEPILKHRHNLANHCSMQQHCERVLQALLADGQADHTPLDQG